MTFGNKTWLKAWGMLVGIFVLGAVTGTALDGLYRLRANADAQAASIRDGDAYFQKLRRELNLTPEQASAIGSVLDETRNEYKAVCAEVRPRYTVLRERARAAMRALLAPDQQQRFDSMVTQDNCNCPDQRK